MALSLQCVDSFLQPVPGNVTSRNVEQPKMRHGDCRGDQLGEEIIMQPVAGDAQLGEAGLKF